MPAKPETTYKVVELTAEEPDQTNRFEAIKVDAGEESMLARATTLEELHGAVSVLADHEGASG